MTATNTPSSYVLSLLASMKHPLNHNNTTTTSTSTTASSSLSSSSSSPPTEGPIEDALCRIEDLEQANDSQLYTILHELIQTSFFRTFHVNLDRKCPLQSWNNMNHNHKKLTNTKKKEEEEKEAEESVVDDDQEEEYQCSGGADELDEDAEPLCSVTGGADDHSDNIGGGGFMFATTHPTKSTTTTTTTSNHHLPRSLFESNALYSLSKDGYQSQSQQEAFSWKDVTDKVIVEQSKDKQQNDDPACIT
jgi:Endoplasmic Reticulum Oxidoreductin 1 (ERO1)